MSDHIDGPRTTADPSIDVTDLYYFSSPTNPKKSVLVGNVFPFAGESALFSDAIKHSFVLRPLKITGIGNASNFQVAGPEIRFSFRFYPLKKNQDPKISLIQTGKCTLPSGEVINIESGNESGSYSSNRSVRVFAGVRSDPFYIGWLPSIPSTGNFLDGDNVLSLVVEFDTELILGSQNSLFGCIFETTPVDVSSDGAGTVLRYDWVGRPEHTNYRLATAGNLDIRDLWNQQEPFKIDPSLLPLFRQRLVESLTKWDLKDGQVDWDHDALNANINVLINDFLVFDTSKPITDQSHLEIEKSTIEGLGYSTGGGRTLNANAADICITWLVNRDRRAFIQSPAYQATKPGGITFPYVQPPNTKLFRISRSVELPVPAKKVWSMIGNFSNLWHPLIVNIKLEGAGIGGLRTSETVDGKFITERLTAYDSSKMVMKYQLVSGLPADKYDAIIEVIPDGSKCKLNWSVEYHPSGIGNFFLNLIVTTMLDSGVNFLKQFFKTNQ